MNLKAKEVRTVSTPSVGWSCAHSCREVVVSTCPGVDFLKTKTYDGGIFPPSYVLFVLEVPTWAELRSGSARGNEDRFALCLFGLRGLEVPFEGGALGRVLDHDG